MSQGEDSGSSVDLGTMRGKDYPTISQFTIFLENRVGALQSFLRRFVNTQVRILALSMNDSTEYCILRCILSHPEQGREILERAGLAMIESDLIAIELQPSAQPLMDVCNALLRAEINLLQTYALMVKSEAGTVVALMVDNVGQAQETLASHGLQMLTENELTELT